MSDDLIEHVVQDKPKNHGNIDALKTLYTDNGVSYYRCLHLDHFYRNKPNGSKEARIWLFFFLKQAKVSIVILVNYFRVHNLN